MPRRVWLVNLFVLGITVAICAVVLEIGLRAAFGAPPPFLEPQVRHQRAPYGYKPVPGQRGVYTLDKPVTTNAFGFRDGEWDLPKPQGRRRILVVGDSFTFGNNNNVEDVYPAVLRRALQQRFGSRVDVLNASAGGWDLDNEVAFLEEEGFGYQPDVVVIGFFPNDLLRPRQLDSDAIAANGRLDARPPWARFIPYSLVFQVKRSALVTYLWLQAPRLTQPTSLDNRLLANDVDLATDPAVQHGYRLFDDLVDACQRRGIPLVVAAIPPVNLFAYPRGSVRILSELRSHLTGRGARFVDLAEPFWDDPRPARHYGAPWDNHFIASGHAIAGTTLAAFLVQEVLGT
jgi:hypothetical protein